MSSRRQYVTIDEVEKYADISSINDTEFEDKISQAEETIDVYVGYQEKFFEYEVRGKLTSASGTTLIDTSGDTPLNVQNNYYTFCEIEIVGGTGAGQRGIISSSNMTNKSVTLKTAFSITPDSTSVYRIYQLGKFPRCTDYFFEPDTQTYYKSIPEAVKRATAAQLEFMVNKGAEFFASDSSDFESESIDTYSYSKGAGGNATSSVKLTAPKARSLLKGISNRTGSLIADNPTEY